MDDKVPAKATRTRKSAQKNEAEKAQSASHQLPQQEPQPSNEQARTPVAQQRTIGGNTFEIKEVPLEVQALAQTRFGRAGVQLQMAAARANGNYKGEVFNSTDFIAQRVGENSVVFHKKENIEFASSNLQYLDQNRRLNGSDLAIHYEGNKAKAYPHDQERDNLAKMVNAMKKTADGLGLTPEALSQFKATLDNVQGAMWESLKERRKQASQSKSPPQQKSRQEPAQER